MRTYRVELWYTGLAGWDRAARRVQGDSVTDAVNVVNVEMQRVQRQAKSGFAYRITSVSEDDRTSGWSADHDQDGTVRFVEAHRNRTS